MNARISFAAAALAAGVAFAAPAVADPMVGGAPIDQNRNIVENAVNSKDHTTLVAAVKAAGLVDTLEGAGPFTVFAPVNKAFEKLPRWNRRLAVEAREQGAAHHGFDLSRRARPPDGRRHRRADPGQGGGKAMLKTVQGEDLTFERMNGRIWVIDGKGDKAEVTISNVMQSNGVIQVINKVLLPG